MIKKIGDVSSVIAPLDFFIEFTSLGFVKDCILQQLNDEKIYLLGIIYIVKAYIYMQRIMEIYIRHIYTYIL